MAKTMKNQQTPTILTSISKGWLHQEGGFNFAQHYYLDPLFRRDQDIKIDQYLEARFPGYLIKNLESNLVQPSYYNPDQIMVGGIQPNLILGMCLGAKIDWFLGRDIDFKTANPLASIQSVDDLPTPQEILTHPVIQQFDAQLSELLTTQPDATIIPPLFWDTSGRATIHGIITTSLKLYGENIFIKIFDDPDFVHSLHQWITDVYITLIQHYSESGQIPVTSVHIGECAGTMLRNSQYEEFIVPYINQIADALGPIRLHSCGDSNHLLSAVQKISHLQILDTGSNTSIAKIRQQIGSEFQIDIAPPVEALLDGAPSHEIVAWLHKTLDENAGGPLLIGFHIEPGYSLENCLTIHNALR